MKLTLRQVVYDEKDLAILRQLMSEEYYAEYFRRLPPSFAASINTQDKHQWFLEDEENQFMGLATLSSFDPHARKVEVGWLLRRGAPREDATFKQILRDLGSYVFDYLEYKQMYSLTLASRHRLHDRLTSIGGEFVAYLPENCHFQGRYHDEVMHRFTVEKYKEMFHGPA